MAGNRITNSKVGDKEYFRERLKLGTDEKGDPIYKNFYGVSKSEAKRMKKDYLEQLESGVDPDLSKQSLARAMNTWLWEIEKNSGNKTSTFERYEMTFRLYVKNSSLGLVILSDLKKLHVQKYYNDLMRLGKSTSIIDNLHKLLSKFFVYACSEAYILKNPLIGLKKPKAENSESVIDDEELKIETFTREEVKKIIESLKRNTKLRYIVFFAVFTGCRIGEILALDKKDISDGFVNINKMVKSVKVFKDPDNYHYEIKITKPKTKGSVRKIPLPEILQKELIRLDVLVKREKVRIGSAYERNSLLFPSLTGTYIDSRNLTRSWKRALESAGVPYKKLHALRHTYATRLFEEGASILTVSKLLGHGSIKTTEIYTHVLDDIKAKEIEVLNNMLL
ncbi:MAG: site-specific integrase [Dethiosulfatibacter sp.]|nr:site-specific integrase [Dethiosulfatibacter sp.]